jgi:hypothetical protein
MHHGRRLLPTQAAGKIALGLIAVGCLATAAEASAATTFGARVDSITATQNCSFCSVVGLKHYDSTTDTGSTTAGILTKVRIRYAGPAAAGVLRVQHPTGVADEFRNDGETAISVAAEATAGGTVQSFPTRTKIAVGDHLGVAINALAMYLHADSDALCAQQGFSQPQPIGGNLTFNRPTCGGNDLLAEGTVEGDADGDSFGDETQDQCPSVAGPQNGCPASVASTPLRKCKKHKKQKKHKGDAVVAKKCKQKHHH